MSEEYRNIYKTARKAAGLTQEAAADRICVSVESIRAYESGQRIPPNDVVDLMVICYNAQYLAVLHVRETNSYIQQIIPELEEQTLLKIAVQVFNRMKLVEKAGKLDRLMEIVEDGVIDDSERPDFSDIIVDLMCLVKGTLTLKVYYDKDC